MSSGGLNQLATIIKRLEAATSRLEDIAVAGAAAPSKAAPATHDAADSSARAAPAAAAASTGAAAAPAAVPPSVAAYDDAVVAEKLQPWIALTQSFAPALVVEQVALIGKLFADQRALLLQAAACRKPSDGEFVALLKPLQNGIEAIQKVKDGNRKERDWFNHLTFVAEGAPVVGWITAAPKPAPHVKEVGDAAQYYGLRIIKEFKEKDPKHQEWVKGFNGVFEALRQYIIQHHTTGLVWNERNGIAVKDYSVPGAAPTGAGAPPPPPPPPPAPAPPPPPPAAPAASGGGGLGAVFADLNRGEDVTRGLRKVDKSEMTHKNPELRGAAPLERKGPAAAVAAVARPALPRKPQSLMAKKPSKFVLEGSKWLVEHHEKETLTIENGEINQIVNLFGCKGTTLVIKGKVNAVTLVNCTKTSVLVDSVISSISVTASPSFTIQITGAAPTIQLDNTDSGQIYLSKQCVDTVELITAKCSAINVSLPEEEDGVFTEKAIPEMLRTVVKGGKLVTSLVEHNG